MDKLQAEGFTAVKFHCWCQPNRDLALVRAARKHIGERLSLMLDVEQRYTRAQALAAVRLLQELGFICFEAPLVDTDLEGYRELRARVDVPIPPAGNWVLDLRSIAQAIEIGCWSSVRVNAAIAGGITPTLKVMALAEAKAMTTELQCWGYTLTQAANLHLMCKRQLHLFRAARRLSRLRGGLP
jgi:L-alanine-DL-glutamate epimerase-like enolase superfamily enzyme